jgi:oxaloacetate decarboxylase alpha subunit/pyruvate carboxylase subunit B
MPAPAQMPAGQPAIPEPPKAVTPEASKPAKKSEPASPATTEIEGTPLNAPMPGMIVNYLKKVGDTVDAGETVVVLEAMKMENALPAPVAGKIQSISFASGDSVAKNDVLLVIS